MLINCLTQDCGFHSFTAHSAIMRMFPGQYLLILALVSFYSVHAGIVKRAVTSNSSTSDAPGSGGPDTSSLQKLLQGVLSVVQQIPLVGGLLSGVVESLVELIIAVELLTNGALSRLLGGSLPCLVSLDNGFECTGITQNGGLSQLLENVVNSLPDMLVPAFLKNLINMLLKGLLDPLLDVLLGGNPDIKA
ncbi:uncharacterized protein LOC117171329 [Belonocnema kinseyi]|uniref:uncharacterized protein LOC117171329 n=1 Tax=Belonocnema kinseyi TaxID=2817044 RepID=UPI00143DB08D|nr:uncharacterized protein LOC117171329 [Belonocnema kinseyi]